MITQYYRVQTPQTGGNFKYNQYALLNLSRIDKQNELGIVNPNNNKENTKTHIHTPWIRSDP